MTHDWKTGPLNRHLKKHSYIILIMRGIPGPTAGGHAAHGPVGTDLQEKEKEKIASAIRKP